MAQEGTKQGLHIRGNTIGDERGMWQAWNGETYLAGANGPMSIFVLGAFLDAMFEGKYHKRGNESNPGFKWMLDQ